MYTARLFWIFTFLGVIVQAMEEKSNINRDYPLAMHMMNLESELQPDFAQSTYVRVIIWNTIPTSEHLQSHFDKFDLLHLEENRLANGRFDIIQKSESTYERFLYAHYPEQESVVTVFVKVDFNQKKNPYSLKNFIKKVNQVLRKYGLINTVESAHDQIDSNDSSPSFVSIVPLSTILPLFICLTIIYLTRKETGMISIIFHRFIPLIVLV